MTVWNLTAIFEELRQKEQLVSSCELGLETRQGAVEAYFLGTGAVGIRIPIERHTAVRGKIPESGMIHSSKIDVQLKILRTHEDSPEQSDYFTVEFNDEDKDNFGLFIAFAERFLDELEHDPELPFDALKTTENGWNRFLEEPQDEVLDINEEIGLVCELEVMLHMLDTDYGPGRQELAEKFNHYWTGPEKSRHDFEFEDVSIECKGTRSNNGLHVEIHGAHQLEKTDGKDLYLIVRKYEQSVSGTLFVPDLVESLVGKGISKERLLSHLGDPFARQLKRSRDEQGRIFRKFVFENCASFLVDENFPGVKGIGDFRRVERLRYSLDLNEPEKFSGYVEDSKLQPSN